jgi:protoheme IX farnesyltransferase
MSEGPTIVAPATTTPDPARGFSAVARDLAALTKPRITLMVVLTAAAGMWLAPVLPSVTAVVVAMLSLAAVVSSANALNCYIERDVDKLMRRTASRPLPADRLAPRPALIFSLALGVVAVPALTFLVNPITGLLGALSLLVYVAWYTPMKQRSPAALLVGAVPGAMPPLMGWTAATGSIDAPGLFLFAVLFLWQLPHFIAIAVFREKEYTRAGHRVLPAVRGRRVAHWHAAAYALALVPVSLAFQPLGVAGIGYTVVAALAGVGFAAMTVLELRPARGDQGARRVFFASLLYLPVVLAALALSSG